MAGKKKVSKKRATKKAAVKKVAEQTPAVSRKVAFLKGKKAYAIKQAIEFDKRRGQHDS